MPTNVTPEDELLAPLVAEKPDELLAPLVPEPPPIPTSIPIKEPSAGQLGQLGVQVPDKPTKAAALAIAQRMHELRGYKTPDRAAAPESSTIEVQDAPRKLLANGSFEADPVPAPPKVYPSRDYTPPAPKDFRTELAHARSEGDRLRALVGMQRSLAGIGAALGGVKRDDGFFNAMQEQAAVPEKRLSEDMALEKQARDQVARQEASDASSTANRAVQDAFMRSFPTLAKQMGEDAIRRMTKDQLHDFLGLEDKRSALAQREQQMQINADLKRAQLEGRDFDRDAKAQAAVDRLELDYNKLLMGAGSRGEQYSNGINQRRGLDAIEKFSAKTMPIHNLVSIMQEIDDLAPGLIRGSVGSGMNIDNWDRFLATLPKGLGSQMNDATKNKLMSAVGIFREYFQRPLAGANFTALEKQTFDKIFHSDLMADPAAAAAAIDLVRRTIGRKLKMDEAGYRTEAESLTPGSWAQFVQSGGLDSSHPIFSDVWAGKTAAPAASAPQTPPSSTPAAPPSNKVQSGTVRVREVSTGVTKTLSADAARKYLGDPRFVEVK